jgi:hypothetical protein
MASQQRRRLRQPNPDSHGDSYRHANSNGDGYRHANSNGDSDCNCNCDCNSNTDSDHYSYSYGHANGDSDGNSNSPPEAYTDPEAVPDAAASPIVRNVFGGNSRDKLASSPPDGEQ